MKKSIYIVILAVLPLFFASCDKEIDKFDNSTNYIYFGIPFVQDQYGRDTKTRVDSLSHSFAMDAIDVTTYTFRIAVNTIGLASAEDRNYTVKVLENESNVTSDDWEATSIANTIMKSGIISDTLDLVVKKSDALSNGWRHIVLQLEANEHFLLGPDSLRTLKISFSNIVTPPSWWDTWKGYFGEFNREKYVKWREIYYLGADPNVDDNGKQLYWDNMPKYPYSANSTKAFIQILKVYFLEHEVYPDGDTTKPRILLP